MLLQKKKKLEDLIVELLAHNPWLTVEEIRQVFELKSQQYSVAGVI